MGTGTSLNSLPSEGLQAVRITEESNPDLPIHNPARYHNRSLQDVFVKSEGHKVIDNGVKRIMFANLNSQSLALKAQMLKKKVKVDNRQTERTK